MRHTILCGHTGSINRGCEAIVRSTVDLFMQQGITSDIATFAVEQDRSAHLDVCGKLIPYLGYGNKMSVRRLYNGVVKKFFHNENPYEAYRQKEVFKAVQEAGSAVVIGGDTYCYNREARLPSYGLLRYAAQKKAKVFLWSCSVESERMDKEMVEYLHRYDMIFPREQLSYQNLLNAGIPEEKLFCVSDSAFVLPTDEVVLPEGFDNVFAYNPSFTLGEGENQDTLFEARVELLQHILKNTDMKIALIPHVYKKDFGDAKLCQELAEALGNNERIMVMDAEYNCCQLKYIISKCRVLIAERTHASIAGYSQLVPTFVIGYSIKSKGIATDLFGTTENAVIPSTDVTNKDSLIVPITRFLEHESEMREQLTRIMPEYIEKTRVGAGVLRRLLAETDQ